MRRSSISWLTGFALLVLYGCQHEGIPSEMDPEAIQFCTLLPGAPATKTAETAEKDAFDTQMGSFQALANEYRLNVEMYQEGIVDALDNANYISYSGLLMLDTGTPLYWPAESTNRYAFKVTAGTSEVETDQSTLERWRRQDKLLGYAFEPLWNDEGNVPVDNVDGLNYRTRKEWRAANVSRGQDDFRQIPLYLKHQRSLVTLILKAGEGVRREDLDYGKAVTNLGARIYSYGAETKVIQAYLSPARVNYDDEEYVPTSQFQAIVEPYDYKTNSTALVANIYLSGQRFSFTAGNDKAAPNDSYNLVAGKNLILTVTLSRGTDQELGISAQIEDWTTTSPTTATIDDFGNQ